MLSDLDMYLAFDAGYYIGKVNGHLGKANALVAAHTYANRFDATDTSEQRIARIFHFGRGWQEGAIRSG